MECVKPGRVWSPSMGTCSGSVSSEPALSNPQSQPTPGCTPNGEDGTGKDCDIVSFHSFKSPPGRRARSVLPRWRPLAGDESPATTLPVHHSQDTLAGSRPRLASLRWDLFATWSLARRLELTQRPMPSLPSPQDKSGAS